MMYDNNWYGHRFILSQYCKVKDKPSFSFIQHGWSIIYNKGYLLRSIENKSKSKRSKFYPSLCWTKTIRDNCRKIGDLNVFDIGSPFLYLCENIKKKKIKKFTKKKGTLFFPAHSTVIYKDILSNDKNSILEIKKRFKPPYTVCLYYTDYNKENINFYKKEKFNVITCGSRKDKNTLYKIYRQITKHEHVVVDEISTVLFYSMYLKTKTTLLINKKKLFSSSRIFSSKDQFTYEKNLIAQNPKLVNNFIEIEKGFEISKKELGFESLKKPEELKKLLGWNSKYKKIFAMILSFLLNYKLNINRGNLVFGFKVRSGQGEILDADPDKINNEILKIKKNIAKSKPVRKKIFKKKINLSFLYNKFFQFFKFEISKWSILIIKNNIKDIYHLIETIKKNASYNKNLIIPPKGSYWADPFLFSKNGKDYIFFENYDYKIKKGTICAGEIKNNKILNVKTVINKNYHLSYPFIFSFKKQIFLIPETHQKKRLEIYVCKKFPYKWQLYSVGFKNQILCDPTIFFYKNDLWLFVNETEGNIYELNKVLKIYKLTDLSLKKFIPHNSNPVIINEFGGRNAGRIFKLNNKIYRPAQINSESTYGEGLVIYEIKKLNNNDFIQKKIVQIYAKDIDVKFSGLHHLDISKNLLTTDVCFKKFRYGGHGKN